jgi:hypothetical protein
MPSSSSCLNSALAAANFSLSSFRNLEAIGGPCVTMWCTTSWLTGGSRLDEQTTAGNSFSRRLLAALAPAGFILLAGPAVWAEEETAPALAGLALAGSTLVGPALAGPALAGPTLAGPARCGLKTGMLCSSGDGWSRAAQSEKFYTRI